MNAYAPVYSVNAQCRDCYNCVRRCPVKAIRVEDDHAVVNPEDCIFCGKCVSTCRHKAKVVRDDLTALRMLLEVRKDVVVSLAPSFASEFPGVSAAKMSSALKKLGFAQVYETARGANIVSRAVAEYMSKPESPKLQISSACPVVVSLIQKYYPEFVKYITPVLSPILAHCREIHESNPGAVIAFIGPCIGKKHESDLHSADLHVALTFEELRRWFFMTGVEPLQMVDDPDYKLPGDGAYYPIEGGMLRSVMRNIVELAPEQVVTPMTLSGIDSICKTLNALNPGDLTDTLFIEALACPGGCVCGPKTQTLCAAGGMLDVLKHAKNTLPDDPLEKPDIGLKYASENRNRKTFGDEEIQATLHTLGKYLPEDELNCGGCGYDSCRELACAILDKHAEPQMCVSHMRQIALKQSSAIDRALPYGLVVADSKLRIIECNERFATLLGESMQLAYEARPGLRDLDLERILPYPELFRSVLETGEEIMRQTISVEEKLFSLTVFNVEPHSVIGALILDVTESEQRRRQLIEKARTVVQNTSKTVQEIAFMLGRNAAQSEIILNSAVEMFAPIDKKDDKNLK